MYLEHRQRKILRKQIKNKSGNLNFEKCVGGISPQGFWAIGHTRGERCH